MTMTLSAYNYAVDTLFETGIDAYKSKLILQFKEDLSMLEFVQVKVQSLLDETKYIKFMEQKAKNIAVEQRLRKSDGLEHKEERFLKANQGLHLHRVNDVRKEARVAALVYGFLKGRSYRQMEPLAYSQPDWKRIEKLVMRYGEGDPRDIAQKFGAWMAEALGSITPNYKKSIQPGSQRGQWTEWMHHSLAELQKSEGIRSGVLALSA